MTRRTGFRNFPTCFSVPPAPAVFQDHPACRTARGSILLLATIIAVAVLVLTLFLISLSQYHTKVDHDRLSFLTAQYTLQGALSAAVIAVNKDPAIQEIQGNGSDWESIVVRLPNGDWRQLSSDLGAIASHSGRQIFAQQGRPWISRSHLDFQVTLFPQPNNDILARVVTVCNKKLYYAQGHLLVEQTPGGPLLFKLGAIKK